jgi:hypothetical protein
MSQNTRSRVRPSSWSRVHIDQTRFGERGGLASMSLPLYQAMRGDFSGTSTGSGMVDSSKLLRSASVRRRPVGAFKSRPVSGQTCRMMVIDDRGTSTLLTLTGPAPRQPVATQYFPQRSARELISSSYRFYQAIERGGGRFALVGDMVVLTAACTGAEDWHWQSNPQGC